MITGQQIFSKITSDGRLELAMLETTFPAPKAGEVLVKMQAAPINPSDMWPMFGPADISKAELNDAVYSAPVPSALLAITKSRLDQVLPVGNEGAGIVVETGEGAEGLMGKTVAVMSGACFAEYCCVNMMACLPLNEGTTAAQGASSFVNPLTALSMVDTMRLEGHTGIVHTAAASNLGQMLNKICIAEDVPLVNIVRKEEQVSLLKELGASYVVNSSADSYYQDLFAALDATGATLAFDATGGGQLANDILLTMERVLSKDAKGLNTYGSEQLKQVYLYGGLDVSPTILNRGYGMAWAVGGYLLPHFLKRVGMERAGELRQRVADEITTTFASHYTDTLSLKDVITPSVVGRYMAKQTGEKFLVNPSL